MPAAGFESVCATNKHPLLVCLCNHANIVLALNLKEFTIVFTDGFHIHTFLNILVQL